MIPKRLGIVTCHKKQRQHVKFGCSCLWDAENRVMHSSDKDGCVFVVDWRASGIKVNNGTVKRKGLKWFTEFGHLNRGDMLTSEQHRCHNEKKKFQRRV